MAKKMRRMFVLCMVLAFSISALTDPAMASDLSISDKTEITNRFLDRLSTGGRLSYDVDAIIGNRDEMTEASYDYFLSLTGLDELCYTYCTVTFGGTRTYDYICEIPDISIGDEVIVPVGEEETEKLAKVTAIKEYRYDEVPYPVSKTKRIIAKYGCGL